MTTTAEKYVALQGILRTLERVVVAFSGGVDSSFLLKAAVDSLGPEACVAVIGVSPSLSRQQHAQARAVAERVGATLVETPVHELEDPDYAANRADRCFHCKTHLFRTLRGLAEERGIRHILCGNNADDRGDYRPGQRAGEALGVRSPLMEAGLTKAEIRQLSRALDLPTADLPASPCLSSRLAYGLPVTVERLNQVERGEALLRELGLREFRVRHHDRVARIECRPEDLSRLVTTETRTRIVQAFKAWGFQFVTLDLEGFRSGALNEALSDAERGVYGVQAKPEA